MSVMAPLVEVTLRGLLGRRRTILLALLAGLPLGVLAAMKRDSWIDHLARTISLVGVSAPTFWLAFVMLAIGAGLLAAAQLAGAAPAKSDQIIRVGSAGALFEMMFCWARWISCKT